MKIRVAIIAAIGLGIVIMLIGRGCEAPVSKGESLYKSHCSGCHGENGESELIHIIPPLANADYMKEHSESIACIIFYGLEGEITVNGKKYSQPMPGNSELNETDITNIANYIYSNFGNIPQDFRRESIEKQLENCN